MRAKQRGASFLGFIAIAAVVGIIGLAVLRLTPVYLEYMRVRQVLTDVKAQYDNQGATVPAIKNTILKRLDVEAVGTLELDDFQITKTESGIEVRAKYDRTVPYVANVSLLVSFDQAEELNP